MTNTKRSAANRHRLSLQVITKRSNLPSRYHFKRWVNAVLLQQKKRMAEVNIRIVDDAESAKLNQTYRHKKGSTNVLSFPFEPSAGITLPLLGDLIICAPVVAREAREQHKPALAHWAHMVVHGVLHLMGHDHIVNAEAEKMEAIEIKILQQLGYANPYLIPSPASRKLRS